MKYKLEIHNLTNSTNSFVYRVATKHYRSFWKHSIEEAYITQRKTPITLQNHNDYKIIQTIDFDSLDQLRSDYPELFI